MRTRKLSVSVSLALDYKIGRREERGEGRRGKRRREERGRIGKKGRGGKEAG